MKRLTYTLLCVLCIALSVMSLSAAMEGARGLAVIALALFGAAVVALVLAVEA